MSKEENNKAIVGRWFTDFWGKTCNLDIVDELASPHLLLQYSLHDPRRGGAALTAFMTDFRKAFPDLNFWGAADLIAEGDHVVGRWEGGGTLSGPAFSDFSRRIVAGRDRPEDAFHRNDGSETQGRHDRRRNRSRRRRDCVAATRTDQSRLITAHGIHTQSRAQPGPLLSADFVTVRPLDQTQIIVQVPNIVLEGFALGDGSCGAANHRDWT